MPASDPMAGIEAREFVGSFVFTSKSDKIWRNPRGALTRPASDFNPKGPPRKG